MKVIKSLCLLSFLFIAVSCATTKVNQENKNSEKNALEQEEVVAIPEPTPEELFIDSLTGIKLEITQTPKQANYNKSFSSSFKAVVTDSDGNPLPNFPVTVSYPSSRENSILHFSTLDLISDETGNVEFTSEPLTFGVDDFVSFYPTPAFEEQNVIDACKNLAAKAEIKSKSDISVKGALLFVWDFNEKDRPVNNSYDVMSELRSYGIAMVGNAPVNESSDIGKPIDKLYKENYEIVENAYGYLICGTIKFTQPVTEIENGYECALKAEITVVNMKDGSIVLEKTYTQNATGKNWSTCTGKCKEDLAVIICKDFVYGL